MTTYKIRDWDDRFEKAASRKIKHLEWVAMPISLTDEDFLDFIDHPNGASHLGAWLAIVMVASQQKERGILPQGSAGVFRSLARITHLPADLFNEAIPRLVSLGWLQVIENKESATNPPPIRHQSPNMVADDGRLVALQDKTGQDMTGHTHITARVFRKVTDMGAQAIPGAFAKFWTLYPRKVHQDEAARAWLSVGADDAAPAVMACLDRYLASDEVSRGVVKNAHNWLFEGARDRWEGEWPKPAKNGAHKQSRTEMLDEIMKDLPKGDWT